MSRLNTVRLPSETGEAQAFNFDDAIRELAKSAPPFTGEQFVPGAGVEIAYEHYARYAFALQFVHAGSTVLDLGCGIGYGSLLLAARAKHVYALDRSYACLAALSGTVQSIGIANITCLESDLDRMMALPALQSAVIDVVVCHEFIEHIATDSQSYLCRLIGEGKPPFHKDTLFLVSNPEQTQYAATRALPNQFHEHELGRDEFTALIKDHFTSARFFWQAAAAANCILPAGSSVFPDGSLTEAPTASIATCFFKWLDPLRLTGSLTGAAPDSGLYLYAAASNGPLPERPQQLILLDPTERNIQERMSIAAKELRSLQRLLAEAKDRKIGQPDVRPAGLPSGEPLEDAFRDLIGQQAQKIQSLLVMNEQLGAELQTSRRALANLRIVSPDPDAAVTELLAWRDLGQRKLNEQLSGAAETAEVLWSYQRTLSSPGHRALSFVSRRAGSLRVVSKLRSILQFLKAVRQAWKRRSWRLDEKK